MLLPDPTDSQTWTYLGMDREGAANEVQMRINAIGGAGSALLANAMKQVANGQNDMTQLNGYVLPIGVVFITQD